MCVLVQTIRIYMYNMMKLGEERFYFLLAALIFRPDISTSLTYTFILVSLCLAFYSIIERHCLFGKYQWNLQARKD